MHPFGPVVDLQQFPMRVDYMDIAASGGGQTPSASTGFTQLFNAASWNATTSLDALKSVPSNPSNSSLPVPIGPTGAQYQGTSVPNRVVVKSPVFTIGQRAGVVPTINSATGDYSNWDPLVFDAAKSTTASVKIRFRPGMGVLSAPARPRQMIPLGLTATDTLQASFPSISLVQYSQPQVISWQIADPRLSSNLAQWQMSGPGTSSTIGTPGQQNVNEPDETSTQKSKYRFIERAPSGAVVAVPSGATYPLDRPDEYNSQSRVTSPGYWSLIHTGMQGLPTAKAAQNPVPWRTLNFGSSASQASPPDWLLLDLLGPTYPMVSDQWQINNTLPDSFSTVSYMNSTAGQVNLNSRIYPQNAYFQPPQRTKPLQAVFQNLLPSTDELLSDINSYQNGQVFDYVGRLADMPSLTGAGTTQWQTESVLRNMAGCLTTRSNTFGVWGVAQVVQKIKKNQKYDQFEGGDQILAEKRFYALVERYIWPGKDGVPGNGHVNPSNGLWDKLATQSAPISTSSGTTNMLFQLPGSPPLARAAGSTTLNLDTNGQYAAYDGPEQIGMDPYTKASLGQVVWNSSSLENAYNPPQAVTKYRVVYFKYLDQ